MASNIKNANEPLRREVLQFLYDVHQRKERSENGLIRGNHLIKRVRERFCGDSNVIAASLDYWVGLEFVQHVPVPLPTSPGIPPMPRHCYRIGSRGIEFIEGPSHFSNQLSANADVTALLKELNAVVRASGTISDDAKADVCGDLDTIERQLSKANPNSDIVSAAWKGVQGILVAAEFADLLRRCSLEPISH